MSTVLAVYTLYYTISILYTIHSAVLPPSLMLFLKCCPPLTSPFLNPLSDGKIEWAGCGSDDDDEGQEDQWRFVIWWHVAVSVRREVERGVVIKWQRSDNAQKMNPLAGKGGSAPPDIDLSNVQPFVVSNTARSPPIYTFTPGKRRNSRTQI